MSRYTREQLVEKVQAVAEPRLGSKRMKSVNINPSGVTATPLKARVADRT